MTIRGFSFFFTLGALTLLTACAGPSRVPSDSMTQPVDLDAFTPKVDTFVVLLDTSDSMEDGGEQNDKFQTALDLVASFNKAVPDMDFQSGLILFGKGAGNCTGHSMANQIYGMTGYNTGDFLGALNAIECTGGGTPIGDALDMAASGLPETAGNVAVFVFSDFMWDDASAVRAAGAALKEQHGDKLCLHAIQVGDYRGSDALVSDMTSGTGCGGVVSAADLASPEAMTAYAAATLMSPLEVPPAAMEYEQQTLSSTMLFGLDSAVLSASGEAELRKLAAYINELGSSAGDIDVIGHTCNLGSEMYNQDLSLRRAEAVAAFLVQQGVASDLIDVSGMGESSPVASNDTRTGRSENRRVEIQIGTIKP